MKRSTTYLLIATGVLLLVIFNWQKLMAFARPKPQAAPAPGGTPTTAGSSDTGTGGSVTSNPNAFLKKGSKGASVRELQKMIIDGWGASALPQYGADGDFGDETEAALISITGSSATTLANFRFNYYQPQIAQRGTNSYTPSPSLNNSGDYAVDKAASDSLWDAFWSRW